MNSRGFFYAFLFLTSFAAIGWFTRPRPTPVTPPAPVTLRPAPAPAPAPIEETMEMAPAVPGQAAKTEESARQMVTTDFSEEEKDADSDLVEERNREELRIRQLRVGSSR